MLEFAESFFQEETIDGFYVESDMKRAWAAQLEILIEIDAICKKHDIQYFAYAGTLLGAVRHKGFIPWDDDLDIAMKRADYQHFMKVVPEEIPSQWRLFSPQLDKRWDQPFGRLVNGGKVNITTEYLKQFHGCPYAVGVDIFPLDYLPSDPAELKVLKELYKFIINIRNLIKKLEDNNIKEEDKKLSEESFLMIEELLRLKIDREENIVNQLLLHLDNLSVLWEREDEKKLACIASISIGNSKEFLSEWYQNTVYLPFENIMMPVPRGYDGALKAGYGDYMTPVRSAARHDYPFYKAQKKQVEDMLEQLKEIDKKLIKLEEGI